MKRNDYLNGICFLLLFPLFFINLKAQTGFAETNIPAWLREDWALRTQQDGQWITDNSVYKNEQEPFEAYGIQWTYGLGNNHLKGRLFCILNGKEAATVWEFLEFWDPLSKEVRVIQIGGNGTLGSGKIWRDLDGKFKEQQTFASPEGTTWESGHLMWMENGEHHTRSYNITNEEWLENRYYVWKQQKL